MVEIEGQGFGEADEGCGGVGGTGSHAPLDGEVFLDVDGDFGFDVQAGEELFDHLPDSVARVRGDAGVAGRDADEGCGRGASSYSKDIMQG